MKTRSGLALLAVGAAVALAGCGGGSSGGPADAAPPITTPHQHTHTPAPTTTSTVTAVPQPTPTVTVTASPAPGTTTVALSRCLSSNLALSLGQSQGAAGSTYTPIVLTNTGSTKCELHGFPGVSFVDAAGNLIGKPASETPGPEKTIKLKSGAAASSTLHQPDPGAFDPSACQPVKVNRLRVYPPGETVPLFIKFGEQVCSTGTGRTDITPMAAGTGG